MSGQIVKNTKTKITPQTSGSNIHMFSNSSKYPNNRVANGLSAQKTNHLSNPNKMNLQNITKINNQDQKMPKYQNLQNYPIKQNNQKYIKDLYKNKDYITMEETLGFLNFINTRQNQAFKSQNIPQDQIQIPQKNNFIKKPGQFIQYNRKNNPFGLNNALGVNQNNTLNPSSTYNGSTSKQRSMLKNSSSGQLLDNQDAQSQGDDQITKNKKKLNKNRAIKRIIETAFGLLEKNYKYTGDNELLFPEEQKSTSTQFNIYLKQYNRIMEQIHTKQTQLIQKSNLLYDQNQQQLQEVFQYTVMEDFRQKLSLVFSKEKISKGNVEMMISAFREGLVILKLNQLKIEFPNTQEPPKLIKMTQIQNVQYYTQPYIFIVLTIVKDRTKSKQYLYLRFLSQENQDKWDRALYCCYMSRKMNKKQKLFEIQFPAEDVRKKQIQQFVKNQEEYQFDSNRNVIDKCFRNDQPYEYSKKATFNEELDNNMFTDRSDYLHKKNTTDQKFTISILNAQTNGQQYKRTNSNMNRSAKNENLAKNSSVKNKSQRRNFDEESNLRGQNNELKNQSEYLDDNFQVKNINNNNEPFSEQSGNFQKKSTFNVNNNQGLLSPTAIKNASSNNTSPQQGSQTPFGKNSNIQNPFMKLMKISQQNNKNMEESMKKQHSMASQTQSPQNLQRLRKLKRVRQIQKENIRGIICQKQKFFLNKEKIIYFYDQSMINSSRKIQVGTEKERQERAILDIQNYPAGQLQRNKYLQYWDYDYKKDLKQQKKLIPVHKIQSFDTIDAIGGSTCTLILNYIVEEQIIATIICQCTVKLEQYAKQVRIFQQSLCNLLMDQLGKINLKCDQQITVMKILHEQIQIFNIYVKLNLLLNNSKLNQLNIQYISQINKKIYTLNIQLYYQFSIEYYQQYQTQKIKVQNHL